MLKFLKAIIPLLFGILSLVAVFYFLSISYKFFDFTHNHRYAVEYAQPACRDQLKKLDFRGTAPDAVSNQACPPVEGSYFISRLIVSGVASVVCLIGFAHSINPDKDNAA